MSCFFRINFVVCVYIPCKVCVHVHSFPSFSRFTTDAKLVSKCQSVTLCWHRSWWAPISNKDVCCGTTLTQQTLFLLSLQRYLRVMTTENRPYSKKHCSCEVSDRSKGQCIFQALNIYVSGYYLLVKTRKTITRLIGATRKHVLFLNMANVRLNRLLW